MLKAILFVNGYPRSGKDEFAKMLSTLCAPQSIFVTKVSTVDLPKLALKALGWDGVSKTEAVRAMLHEIKMAWTRHMDGSFNYVASMAAKCDTSPYDHILVVDSREPEELARFKDTFGSFNAHTVFVHRENSERANNDADSNVENFVYDITVMNRDFPEDSGGGMRWLYNLENETQRMLDKIL